MNGCVLQSSTVFVLSPLIVHVAVPAVICAPIPLKAMSTQCLSYECLCFDCLCLQYLYVYFCACVCVGAHVSESVYSVYVSLYFVL